MKRKLLFIVRSDPRTSPRPAEAVRIAAGIGAWQGVGIRLYLHGEAARLLREDADLLVDGELYERYLPDIAGWGQPVLVEASAHDRILGAPPSIPAGPVQPPALAELAAACDGVLTF
jgi:hypothetical protein